MRRPDDDEQLDYLKENGLKYGCNVVPIFDDPCCDHCCDEAKNLVPVPDGNHAWRSILLCNSCARRVVDELLLDQSPLTEERGGLNADWSVVVWPTVIPDLYICDEEEDHLYSLVARDLTDEDWLCDSRAFGSAQEMLDMVGALHAGLQGIKCAAELATERHAVQWAAALVRAIAAREMEHPVDYPFYAFMREESDSSHDAMLARLFYAERSAQIEDGGYSSDEHVATVLAWG